MLVPISKKREREDMKKSYKAEIAANLETKIKQELLERLKKVFLQTKTIISTTKGNLPTLWKRIRKAH